MDSAEIDVDRLIDRIDGGDLEAAARLLAAHPELATRESRREDAGGKLRGATPLHWAAHRDAVDLCRQLIELGVDVDARQARWWRTPLAWAADAGRADAVELLLAHGADANADTYGNTTALHAVAQGGSTGGARDPAAYRRTAELLIAAGVEIDRRTDYDGGTALDDAIRAGNTGVAEILAAHGATTHRS